MTRTEADYQLLDSGNMEKLEQVGPYRLRRPSPQAVWLPKRSKDDWDRADGIYVRDSSGDGKWEWNRKVSREFDIIYNSLAFHIKLTNFGHMGLFPEQADNWTWLRDKIRRRMLNTNHANIHVLNLFAYTGGSTLAASQTGAHVVHVDAAKGVVDWARTNAKLSHLDRKPIRWLVDDAMKFVKREARRGNRYHGIILDPPSFGRGPKGEVFKIEDSIMPLMEACGDILRPDAQFVVYSCHTPGFTPITLANQLETILGKRSGAMESGEMTITDGFGRHLPSGSFARWAADNTGTKDSAKEDRSKQGRTKKK
jgi:23S rRNA (cytosine1962-C5)-methyltransferase